MKKNKEKLLIDKKECVKCGHILEKGAKTCDECGYTTDEKKCSNCDSIIKDGINVCDECGYDMTMEESFKILSFKFKKFLNEQTQPGEYEYNPKKDPANAQKITTTKTPLRNLKPGSTVKVTADESKKKKLKKKKLNPWAICTSSVGREDMKKYEKCVMDIKKQHKMDEDLQKLEEYIERIITDSEINPKIKKGNFNQFLSKLK